MNASYLEYNGSSGTTSQWGVFSLLVSILLLLTCTHDESEQTQVVVYTSLDKVFSEPILRTFEHETGIKVLAVYDSEATKKSKPKANVVFNSEEDGLAVHGRGALPEHLISTLGEST